MEDKQLNLNQPLLSVRRISSTGGKDDKRTTTTDSSCHSVRRPPPYKSELKSGPVSNPGVVPFLWEWSPGRPKDETSSQTDRPPIVPKLPPGRISKPEKQTFCKAPESPKSEMEKLRSFGSSEDEEKFESADEDETYVDALDTLSRTESFFMNCSVSDLSGLGLEEADKNLLGTSPKDPLTRDFMIDRFLPAAKAMASCETPQYAPKKQPVVQEQPRQLKKATRVDMRPQLRYGPSFAKHYYQSHDYAEEGNDDDEHEYLAPKVCGLLPRFCLKSSFLLMNPVPGMRVRTRVPMSPSSRMQTRSSSAGSCSGTENERSTSDLSEQHSVFGVLTAEAHQNKNDLEDEFKRKTTHEINDHKLDESSSPQSYEMKAGFSTRAKSGHVGCDQSNATLEDSENPAAEKTLYVDTVHKVEESSILEICSPEKKRPSQLIKEDHKEKMDDFPFIEASNLNFADGGTKIKPIVQETVDLNPPLFPTDTSNSEVVRWKPGKARGKVQFFNRGTNTQTDWKIRTNESSIKKETRTDRLENTQREFHVPPPLPQSPSESWLCRTLPSLPTKNSSLRPYLGNGNPKNQAFRVPSGDPKWETMVKTTKGHHQHLRYSEELMTLTPIPETL